MLLMLLSLLLVLLVLLLLILLMLLLLGECCLCCGYASVHKGTPEQRQSMAAECAQISGCCRAVQCAKVHCRSQCSHEPVRFLLWANAGGGQRVSRCSVCATWPRGRCCGSRARARKAGRVREGGERRGRGAPAAPLVLGTAFLI